MASAATAQPGVDRVDAVDGRPALIPWVGEEEPSATDATAGGSPVAVEFVRLGRVAAAGPREWLPPASVLVEGEGAWHALLAEPEAGWSGVDSVTVGGVRLPVRALEAWDRADPALRSPNGRWTADAEGLSRLLSPDLEDPLRRWRWTLVTGRGTRGSVKGIDRALAAIEGARWAAALRRLHAIDAGLGARVRRALGAAVRLESGSGVPAMAPLDETAYRLRGSMLEDAPGDAVIVAEAWLRSRPGLVAWVEGVTWGVSGSVVQVGVVSLAGEGATIPVRVFGEGGETTRLELRGGVAKSVWVRAERVVEIRAEDSGDARRLAVPPIERASPPGVWLGPTLAGLTRRAWLGGGGESGALDAGIDPAWSTVALVQRAPGPRPVWRVYVECRSGTVAEGTRIRPESVRLWVGGESLEVTREGALLAGVAGREGAGRGVGGRGWVEVSETAASWSFWLELDEIGREVDFAVERFDARGVRSSAPARLGPWMTRPMGQRVRTDSWWD